MPLFPRGNPLTESMPFTDGGGVGWLAYIEGVPTDRPRGARSHGSSAYQKKKGPKQITASALVAPSARRQGE